MAQTKYAKDQPVGFTNHIERVAIVGAGGHVGSHIVEELLKTGKHTVTALTRADSKSTFPKGVKVAQINYNDEDSIVSALKGQQFLVITLSIRASAETHSLLVKAAVKAGVPYIMPNGFGYDIHNKALNEDLNGNKISKYCSEIESLGSSYIVMVCGFWYEWSLALPQPWFGFDIKTKKLTFYDDGKTHICSSTWKQCGRALAGLLNLKELPDDANDKSLTVSQWKNKPLYISSFHVSQREMLDSLNRVIGTQDKDWEIDYEPTADRYKKGLEETKAGNRMGIAKAMYARAFYPNGDGDYESKGLANSALGLPKEDLDEATKRTVEMVNSGWNPFAQ